jgi:heptosyltransferase-2
MTERIRYTLVKWQYALIDFVLNVLRTSLFKSLQHASPQNILIVRKGTLGDIITIMPVIASLRKKYPIATLYLLTEDYNAKSIGAAEIMVANTFAAIMRMSEYSPAALSDKLKSLGIEAVIELPQALDTLYTQTRNMLYFRWMCGIRYGAGWQVCTTLLFRKTQLRQRKFVQETERHFKCLQSQGVDLVKQWEYAWKQPLDTDELIVNQVMAKVGEKPMAVIATGAKHARKRWPLDRFITIADRLNVNGWQVCWMGNEEDARHLNQTTFSGYNACGKLTIVQSIQLMKHAKLFIGNDSGPMHMAYACGVPVVALFSLRDYPGKWYPPMQVRHVVLSDKTVPCAICWDKPCNDNICMKSISVDEVWNAVQQMINHE